MRQQDKVIIWSAYFDSTKTRKQGRRVPKNLGVPIPRTQELSEAAEKLKIEHELVPDVAYPGMPWTKTGMLLIKKKASKEKVIRELAVTLSRMRSSSTFDQKAKA